MSVECSVDRRTYPWCRVCLTSNVRMCSITNIKLREVYEKLTSTQADDDHGIPPVICFICCSLLRRAHRFSEMAHRSQTILEEMRLQGIEAHQIYIMPNFEIKLKLSVTDICAISIPNYSNCQNARDLEIVSEVQNTVAEVETVCDEEIKLEEIHSTSEEDEIYDDHTDPTHAVPCDEVIVLDSSLSKDGVPSSVTDNAVKQNAVVEVETVHDEKFKLEEIHSTPEEDEIYDDHRDPTHAVPCNEVTILDNMLSIKDEVSYSVTDNSMIKKEVVHDMKANEQDLHNEHTVTTSIVRNKIFNKGSPLQPPLATHIGEKPFKCKICQKTFSCKRSEKAHLRIHTGEKPFKCKLCNKTFLLKLHLQCHLRTHSGEKACECKICKKKFFYQRSLMEHFSTHTLEKPFKCKMCNKAFTQNAYLQSHLRTHTGERPYECKICNKTFTYPGSLNYHRGIHFKEKRYECEICSDKFVLKRQLNLHIKTHTVEKSYNCIMCSETFCRQMYLKEHQLIHTTGKPYKCKMCNKSFIHEAKLQSHIRIHNRKNVHKCEICNETFTWKYMLQLHIGTHTRENSYKCNMCNKIFSRQYHLKQHMRTHTIEKDSIAN